MDVLEQQKLAIAHDADAKEFLANEKVAASLAREENTKLAAQKKIDDAAIRSKVKLRANSKRSPEVLEKEREALKKKNRKQLDKFAK